MQTVGRLCITLAPRYAISISARPLPHILRQGYLDIVRWLCEQGGAATSVNGVRGVDARSKGGWTPLSRLSCWTCRPNIEVHLVNAASKGHLPIVLYLLTKQSANPLVRNNWGETAYDASAAVFEVWICQVS
jgi:ankyrin repeat protein